MISYTNMEYLPLFLMFYQSLLKKKVTNFLAFVTDQEVYMVRVKVTCEG